MNKCLKPSAMPLRVTPRKKKITRTRYGKVAVTYTTFPEEAMPFIIQKYTKHHATTKDSPIFQLKESGELILDEAPRVVLYQKYCVGPLTYKFQLDQFCDST